MNIYLYLNGDGSVACILDEELDESVFTPMQEKNVTVMATTLGEVEAKLPEGFTLDSLVSSGGRVVRGGGEFSFNFNVFEDSV